LGYKAAEKFLKSIKPFSIIKYSQIEIALKFRDLVSDKDIELYKRENLKMAMNSLNRVGTKLAA
jgi:hypothetical protein